MVNGRSRSNLVEPFDQVSQGLDFSKTLKCFLNSKYSARRRGSFCTLLNLGAKPVYLGTNPGEGAQRLSSSSNPSRASRRRLRQVLRVLKPDEDAEPIRRFTSSGSPGRNVDQSYPCVKILN